jgi:myo-inositol 2-dehydrogenase/D-chiro-inositol 1-dehydrogenase
LTSGRPGPARLTFVASEGSLTLELPPALEGPSRLVRADRAGETSAEIDPWDRHAAILDVLAGKATHPNLEDGTRATEVSEGVVRSLRRGRTVELHYGEVSEEGTFKSVMTSFGCLILLSILFVLPLALAGPAIGIGSTIYIAYAIPPILVVFSLLQILRFAIRRPEPRKTE